MNFKGCRLAVMRGWLLWACGRCIGLMQAGRTPRPGCEAMQYPACVACASCLPRCNRPQSRGERPEEGGGRGGPVGAPPRAATGRRPLHTAQSCFLRCAAVRRRIEQVLVPMNSSRRVNFENTAGRQTRFGAHASEETLNRPSHAPAGGPGTTLVSACLPGRGEGVAGRSPAPGMRWQP